MENFHFSLIAPDRIILERSFSMVILPGVEGLMGILPQHSPLVTLLRPGIMALYDNDLKPTSMFVDGGFVEVSPRGCTALVTGGVPVDHINKESLEIEIETLLGRMKQEIAPEDKKKVNQRLELARAKLMELLKT